MKINEGTRTRTKTTDRERASQSKAVQDKWKLGGKEVLNGKNE
jgi:hypothetical protein